MTRAPRIRAQDLPLTCGVIPQHEEPLSPLLARFLPSPWENARCIRTKERALGQEVEKDRW